MRAQRPARVPVVLSRDEVARLLGELRGPVWLMASLMYGAGLRLLECAELRVKDVSADRGELTVRDGKGGRDRVTMLPAALKLPLLDRAAAGGGAIEDGLSLCDRFKSVVIHGELSTSAQIDWWWLED